MKEQHWIFTVHYAPEGAQDSPRCAVAGPARASTAEAALHLANMPESVRVQVRADKIVRKFVDGMLDPAARGYYTQCPPGSDVFWVVCIGSIQVVLP